MARQKTIVRSIKKNEAETAFGMYNSLLKRLKEIEEQKNEEIALVKKQYTQKLDEVLEERNKAFDIIHAYAIQHPELFDKRKSVQWNDGTFGYRTGMPKLKTCNGMTWENVLTLAKTIYPDYVRTVEELNKDLIIADREKLKEQMLAIGVEVVQDETFFVQPNTVKVAV